MYGKYPEWAKVICYAAAAMWSVAVTTGATCLAKRHCYQSEPWRYIICKCVAYSLVPRLRKRVFFVRHPRCLGHVAACRCVCWRISSDPAVYTVHTKLAAQTLWTKKSRPVSASSNLKRFFKISGRKCNRFITQRSMFLIQFRFLAAVNFTT